MSKEAGVIWAHAWSFRPTMVTSVHFLRYHTCTMHLQTDHINGT